MMRKKAALLCLLLMALTLPVFATEPVEAPTLPPRIIGVRQLTMIPDNWSPLETRDANQEAVLALTSEPLYRIGADGMPEAAQAADFPADVTAEFAGAYGIPEYAARGYAFAISLRDGAFWEDGKPVTVADWIYTAEMLLERERFPLELAGYQAYLRGDTHPAPKVISLMDAGYSSAAEAEAAGIRDFYVDTAHFWGLDTGWQRITDRNRLFDAAIPSGCEEMYISPAYLYRQYLSDTGSQSVFQSEFVGIPAEEGEKLTIDDVGLMVRDNRLIVILQEPSTAVHIALSLAGIYPLPQGVDAQTYGTAENYIGCGTYRIETLERTQILLVPNPRWTGTAAEFEEVFCRSGS